MSGGGHPQRSAEPRWATFCTGDHFGRLIGKRIPYRRYMDVRDRGLAVPDFHLVTNAENIPYPDMAVTGLDGGFRNGLLKPIPGRSFRLQDRPEVEIHLCRAERTDGRAYEEAPRRMLERQVDRLAEHGIAVSVATELEFYLFDMPLRDALSARPAEVRPFWVRNADNDVLLTDRAAPVLDEICACLEAADIPVESIQGEGGPGQFEINIGAGDPLEAADRHVVFKHIVRHVASQAGVAATFMAKPRSDWAGSGGHVHACVSRRQRDTAGAGESRTLADAFIAGVLRDAAMLALMYCPTVNSYRRFCSEPFVADAPGWGDDDRTAMVRRVADERGSRFELRLPGADMNPYHAVAALLASGTEGVREGAKLQAAGQHRSKDACIDRIPGSLDEAIAKFAGSSRTGEYFGPVARDHLAGHAQRELDASRAVVTDWEWRRYFAEA